MTLIFSVMTLTSCIANANDREASDALPPSLSQSLPPMEFDRSGPIDADDDSPVLIKIRGEAALVNASSARAEGYTIIDLSDQWVPRIFHPQVTHDGQMTQSEYAQTYVDLANDRVDADGHPLPPHEANYLEVYGIHPTLSVLRKRFERADSEGCMQRLRLDDVGIHRHLNVKFGRRVTPFLKDRDRLKSRLLYRVRKLKAEDMESLAQHDRTTRRLMTRLSGLQSQLDAFTAIEARLRCEGLIYPRDRHRVGTADYPLATALYRFRLRNALYERWGLRGQAMTRLAEHPQQLNHDAFVRVIHQRVINAVGIIEDGSAWSDGPVPTYVDEEGRTRVLRDLAGEFLSETLIQLDVSTPEKALDFLREQRPTDLKTLRVGVKLPSLPPYYRDHMDLKVVIDRGTVWYDYPWRSTGQKKAQKRPHLPTLTLMTTYLGQDIPLVQWPTTIGGWHEETDGAGQRFLRYKNSDVGSRVIRNVVAAPIWLPPNTTPVKDLIEKRRDHKTGRTHWRLKDRLLGPGHQSAYGLVAGYLVIPGQNGRRDWDRGIRIHGSASYLSITSRRAFSHGCHRMRNSQAAALFGFILNRRQHIVHGPMGRPFKMKFKAPGRVLRYAAEHRGFQYELVPPLPVTVSEGDLRGRHRTPLKGRYPRPHSTPPVAQRSITRAIQIEP